MHTTAAVVMVVVVEVDIMADLAAEMEEVVVAEDPKLSDVERIATG